jgi:uncharacterized membrane protein YdbT with pleckstrin-like domain
VDPERDEQIFFHGHPSWRSILDFYLKGVLLSVLLGAIAGAASRVSSRQVDVGWVILGVLAVFVPMLTIGLVRLVQTTYTVTDRRLTIDTGILSRELHETRLERVQNVNVRQSLLERLLRVGTVDFDTAASADYDFEFRGVADPHRIMRAVDRALQELPEPAPRG